MPSNISNWDSKFGRIVHSSTEPTELFKELFTTLPVLSINTSSEEIFPSERRSSPRLMKRESTQVTDDIESSLQDLSRTWVQAARKVSLEGPSQASTSNVEISKDCSTDRPSISMAKNEDHDSIQLSISSIKTPSESLSAESITDKANDALKLNLEIKKSVSPEVESDREIKPVKPEMKLNREVKKSVTPQAKPDREIKPVKPELKLNREVKKSVTPQAKPDREIKNSVSPEVKYSTILSEKRNEANSRSNKSAGPDPPESVKEEEAGSDDDCILVGNVLNYSQFDDDIIVIDDDDDEEDKFPDIKQELVESLTAQNEEDVIFDSVDLTCSPPDRGWHDEDDQGGGVSPDDIPQTLHEAETAVEKLFGPECSPVHIPEKSELDDDQLLNSLLSQKDPVSMPFHKTSPLSASKAAKRKSLPGVQENYAKKVCIEETKPVPPRRRNLPLLLPKKPQKHKTKKPDPFLRPSEKKKIQEQRRKKLKELAEKKVTSEPGVSKSQEKEKYNKESEVNDAIHCTKVTDKTRRSILIDALANCKPTRVTRASRALQDKNKEKAQTKPDTKKADPKNGENSDPCPVGAKSSLKKRGSSEFKKLKFASQDKLVNVKYYEKDSSRAENHPEHKPYSEYAVIFHACKWNPKWIEESVVMKTLPPLLNETSLMPLVRDIYPNFREYQNTMYPLMIYELWETIVKEANKEKKEEYIGIVTGSSEIAYNLIHGSRSAVPMNSLTVHILSGGKFPKKGDYMTVFSKEVFPDGTFTLRNSFGFVQDTLRMTKLQHLTNQELKRQLMSSMSNVKWGQTYCLAITLVMRKRASYVWRKGSSIQLKVVMNMMRDVRVFAGITQLADSPLCPVVMNPSMAFIDEDFVLKEGFNPDEFVMNKEQLLAVHYCSNMAKSDKPGLAVIHGPPGTGKSVTIARLVAEILGIRGRQDENFTNHGSKLRILLCAPSNFAVDELVRKMVFLRENLPVGNRFNLVRVGNFNLMSPEAKSVSLVSLSKRNSERLLSDKNYCKKKKAELEAREKLLLMKLSSNTGSKDHYFINELRREIRNLQELLEDKKYPGLMERVREQSEKEILIKSNVIVTTLAGVTSTFFNNVLRRRERVPFCCCVVDEASQAIEPLTLTPLLAGVERLVLVGDHLQLSPVVTCTEAKENGLGLSLFERLYKLWQDGTAPLFPLTKQYRMHPEVLSFPNKKFYGGRLSGDETPLGPLNPYLLLCHRHLQSKEDDRNEEEAAIIMKIVELMNKNERCNDLTVGIITPYQAQRIYLQTQLRNAGCSNMPVYTVDSAQGQEKHVILLSTVKTQGLGFLSDPHRLNVALTRAKTALIIVSNYSSLKASEVWKDLVEDAKKRQVYCPISSKIPLDKLAGIIFTPENSGNVTGRAF